MKAILSSKQEKPDHVDSLSFPQVTDLNRPFWEGCADGRLFLQFCEKCMKFQWYPRPLCIRCGRANLQWKESLGRGIVYSFTIVRFPVQTYRNPVYFKSEFPYAVGLVELEEKVRIYARITECDLSDIRIGMRVDLTFVRLTDALSFPAFRPALDK
jgi:uncharacterized OB-fold protein